MNNDKLLRAFIEASGYEIKEAEVTVPYYSNQWRNYDGSLMDGAVPIGTKKVIDYKVTKRNEPEFSKKDRLILLEKEIEGLLKDEED